jgi:hypothetical protein
MNLRNVKPGDRVEVNVRGRVFPAHYEGFDHETGRVLVEPLVRNVNYRSVKKTEVRKRLTRTAADGSMTGRDPAS